MTFLLTIVLLSNDFKTLQCKCMLATLQVIDSYRRVDKLILCFFYKPDAKCHCFNNYYAKKLYFVFIE